MTDTHSPIPLIDSAHSVGWAVKTTTTTTSIAINLRWKVFRTSADLGTLMLYRAQSELSRRRRHQAMEHSDSDEL